MAFTFPNYDTPTQIDATRSWTATFASYDQRNDDVYYVVTIHEGGTPAARFTVQVWPHRLGDDWSVPGFVPYLHDEIHLVAVTGKTNTAHVAPMQPLR